MHKHLLTNIIQTVCRPSRLCAINPRRPILIKRNKTKTLNVNKQLINKNAHIMPPVEYFVYLYIRF